MEIRMVDKIGGSRGLLPPFNIQEHKESSVTWYEGSLPTDKTAGYLQRLSRLHENLIQSETIQLTKIMNSFPKITSANNTARKKPISVASSYASAPSLHARKQMDKILEIDRRRKLAMRSPPPLTIGVKGIEDPIKVKQKSAKKVEPPKDPFDPSNLEPNPIDKLFNMERLRLLNTALQDKSKTQNLMGDKKVKVKTRNGDLLTPRTGTEWFITGRYKKEPRKPARAKLPKHKKDRSKKMPQRPPNLSACNSLKQESAASETKSSNGEGESSIGEGQHSNTNPDVGENYNVPASSPIQWDHTRPKTGGPVDSTANIMLAIASTAEANKAENKSKNFNYDPNNYKPIGTPKSSPRAQIGPLEASTSSSSMTKFEDLRRSKVIAAALQGSVDENGDGYQHFESTNKKRQSSEQSPKFQKLLQGGTFKSKVLSKVDAAIKVPVPTGSFNEGQVDSSRSLPDGAARLEVTCMSPPHPGESNGEALFVPTKKSQPLIKLRHSSPELFSTTEKVSLNKIVRQNELRQRELGNLFEDIKELNRVSETLRKPNESSESDQKD